LFKLKSKKGEKMKRGIILAMALLFASFNAFSEDAQPKSKHGRVDVSSSNVALKPVKNCSHAGWIKDEEKKKRRILGVANNIKADEWKELEMEFIPEADGTVIVSLRGMWFRPKGEKKNLPVWIYFDEIEVEGADLANGDFEEVDEKGKLKGWKLAKENLVKDENIASSGKNCIKAWHNQAADQKLKVTKDQPVKIKAKMKAVK
jgi:hypothetical protein